MTTTRFAPSPTGYLHIGGLRTALYSYLWAKKNHGKFHLRIEDTDHKRNNDDALKAIIEAFHWCGLHYDDKEVYQSQRSEIYKSYINQLLKEGKAYYCYMSKEELDALREEQIKQKQTPKYNRKYRDFQGIPPADIAPVIRIKAPVEGKIEFNDGVKGLVSFDIQESIDDFIIARSDGTPTYNFVVTIDDALMNMSDVIRGDDHLINTPKQILLYEALGFDIPTFYHVPMIHNPEGKKLSKRDGALDVMEYKQKGYLPEALLNFLVRLGWSHNDQEIFSMDEMLEFFDPNNINKSASCYNEEKLLWLNAHYIQHSDNLILKELLKEFSCNLSDNPKCETLLNLYKPRAQTLLDLKNMIEQILHSPKQYEEKGVKKFIQEETKKTLSNYVTRITTIKPTTVTEFEGLTKAFIKENQLKMPQLLQPIRLALTGTTAAPSVYELLSLLGWEESINRIEYALNNHFGSIQ